MSVSGTVITETNKALIWNGNGILFANMCQHFITLHNVIDYLEAHYDVQAFKVVFI